MTTAVSLIRSLEETASRNEKEKLLRDAFESGHREFFAAARICLDPIVTYGIKKVTLVEDDYPDGDLSFVDFMKFAERLRKRELTGNAAIEAMRAASDRTPSDVWNTFYRRILLKDFKAGFDHSTVNRVLKAIGTPEAKQYMVPVFSCQLAKSGDEHPKKMVGPKFLDVKFNGVRLLTVVDKQSRTVTQYTRNGNVNANFPHIREEFERIIDELPISLVFDGEVIGQTFQELMSQLSRKSDAKTDEHKLVLFDVVPLDAFLDGKCSLSQRKRHETLVGFAGLFQAHKMISVSVLPKVEVNLSTPEGKARMEEFQHETMEAAKAAGATNVIEGYMIKCPDAPYVCKKGTNWLKWKPWIAVDLVVVGMEIGDPEGKFGNTLGALVCEGVDEGRHIRTNVSTGMTEEQRDYFWNNPSEIVGYIIEVHSDELTQDKHQKGTNNYSLRFPSFAGVRGLAAGDKI